MTEIFILQSLFLWHFWTKMLQLRRWKPKSDYIFRRIIYDHCMEKYYFRWSWMGKPSEILNGWLFVVDHIWCIVYYFVRVWWIFLLKDLPVSRKTELSNFKMPFFIRVFLLYTSCVLKLCPYCVLLMNIFTRTPKNKAQFMCIYSEVKFESHNESLLY